MVGLQKKTIQVRRGFTYSYYTSAPADSDSGYKPLLFHHGWPDGHTVWTNFSKHLGSIPNQLIIPDLLGFGDSDKPTEVEAFAYDGIAQDMIEILDAEGIDKVVSIGHDHGSPPAQRLYNYYPDRVAGLVLFNIPYTPPSKSGPPFDLEAVNAWSKGTFGYPQWEYWKFFVLDPDAPRIMDENVERVWEVAHAKDMKGILCVDGAVKAYMTNKSLSHELEAFAYDISIKNDWVEYMSKSGFGSSLYWYKAVVQDVQRQSDLKVKDENVEVKVPVLFIGGKHDPVCRADRAEQNGGAELQRDLTTVIEDTAHWPMYEKPESVAKHLANFLGSRGL